MNRTVEILEKVKSEAIAPFAIFQAVCLDIAEETKANRVSIWHLEKDHSCIRCDCFYEAEEGTFSEGQVLFANDHPQYFTSILAEKFIVAPDARDHTATAELTDDYFRPHDIYSLLDFVIHENFKPTGVICCENAGTRLEWRDDDVSYLRQISTLISFYFKLD